MKKLTLLVVAAWAAAGSFLSASSAIAAGDDETRLPIRVEFTSDPEGASVYVDGEAKGKTPLVIRDLGPGKHHARFQLDSRETADDFFAVDYGSMVTRHVELKKIRGLLLLTSDPAGATVMRDGLSLGETPRLITTLPAGETQRMILRKAGYQDRAVEIRLDGRTPMIHHEKLILDSGVLKVVSEPAGAEVTVNGIVRGRTPVDIRDIPKGHTVVVVKKDGYEPVKRELALNAGDVQTLDVKLEGIPGAIAITTVPDGSRIYINGQAEGKAPVYLKNLRPGNYRVRVEADGCGTVERTLEVKWGATTREEFRLANILGSIELKTNPPDAQVYVDGRLVGTTKGSVDADLSDVFTVRNLKEGEHTVTVRKHGFAEAVLHPIVESSKAVAKTVRLRRVFTPDVEIVTNNGTVRGVLKQRGESTIEVEVKMGIVRTIMMSEVREVHLLDAK